MALTHTQMTRKFFLKEMTPKLSLIGRVEYQVLETVSPVWETGEGRIVTHRGEELTEGRNKTARTSNGITEDLV